MKQTNHEGIKQILQTVRHIKDLIDSLVISVDLGHEVVVKMKAESLGTRKCCPELKP